MELLSPAGNIDKLQYAYQYGADAAYIGIGSFSLRAKADNFYEQELKKIKEIKGDRKLYCALNIFFHNQDLKRLEENLALFEAYPFDAFIISDVGILSLLKKHFPGRELHLSTQANSINSGSVKFYQDQGFSRIILGRETSLKEIEEIKRDVPDVELETFIHGAMCLAYSGRCYISSWMTGRSGNDGSCAHSCRWNYRLRGTDGTPGAVPQEIYLEEEMRPGEYHQVIEGDGFSTLMSSKDICMIDNLQDLKDAGVDSVKIEGRMKSVYYTAVVTRAYRKALDKLDGRDVPDYEGFREELFKVSHREFSTGFYYGKKDIERPTEHSYQRAFLFLGTVGKAVEPGIWELDVKNKIRTGDALEFIGPDLLFKEDRNFTLMNEQGEVIEVADHAPGRINRIKTEIPLKEGYILRRYSESKETIQREGR